MDTLRDICEDLVENAGGGVAEIDAQVMLSVERDGETLILDVRTIEERVQHGVVPGDRHAVLDLLPQVVDEALFGRAATEEDRARPVVCYCAAGVRSLLAARVMREMGYACALSLRGGFHAWRKAGGGVGRVV